MLQQLALYLLGEGLVLLPYTLITNNITDSIPTIAYSHIGIKNDIIKPEFTIKEFGVSPIDDHLTFGCQ